MSIQNNEYDIQKFASKAYTLLCTACSGYVNWELKKSQIKSKLSDNKKIKDQSSIIKQGVQSQIKYLNI